VRKAGHGRGRAIGAAFSVADKGASLSQWPTLMGAATFTNIKGRTGEPALESTIDASREPFGTDQDRRCPDRGRSRR
jgi:hypothetical protein